MKVKQNREIIKSNPLDILDNIDEDTDNKFPITKPEINNVDLTFVQEMNKIMKYLGREYSEGEVRGTHLGKVLYYLVLNKGEQYEDTQYKLALALGVSPRLIRENYLKPFEKYKFIYVFMGDDCNRYWEWRGISK